MSIHNTIVLTSAPAGRFLEGTIEGTPKPGTAMEIKPGVSMDGSGRHTWRVYQPGTDGERRLVAILLENVLVGKGPDDAYVTGDRGYLYCPIPGDELKVLVANIAGTGDAFAVGAMLIPDTGTGLFIATTGSPEMEPFQVMEAVAALTADTLVWCQYTGH